MRRKKNLTKAIGALLFVAIINVSYLFSDSSIIDGLETAFGWNARIHASASGTILINTASDWDRPEYNYISGTGGQYDPFIIANRTIDGGNTTNGITINGGGGMYFVIRNCTIKHCPVGIKLSNIMYPGQGIVTNNTILNSIGNASWGTGNGIDLRVSSHLTIDRNIIRDCVAGSDTQSGIGIMLSNVNSSVITNNKIERARVLSTSWVQLTSEGMLFVNS